MGQLSKYEDDWQAKATAVAVAEARKAVAESAPLMSTPVGRLNDLQWSIIIASGLFGWITTRCQQAIAEGWDQENAVELGGFEPSPADVAAVKSILPLLPDQAGIDWKQPLESWSKDMMIDFLLLAWRLVSAADVAREHGPGILKKANTKVVNDIPF